MCKLWLENHLSRSKSMAQAQKEIRATQQFLSGLKCRPTCGALRAEEEKRLQVLRKHRLSVTDSAALLEELTAGEIWDWEGLSRLKAVIAEQTIHSESQPEKGGKERTRQQDYRSLVHYLDQNWWDKLERGNFGAAVLSGMQPGLKWPSEPTYAVMTALVCGIGPHAAVTESMQHQGMQQCKPRMKRMFQQAQQPLQYVETLPLNPPESEEALLRQAYPAGFTAGEPKTERKADLMHAAQAWPLRTSSTPFCRSFISSL